MSQPGESDEMTAFDHVQAIINHSCEGIIDACIANVEPISEEMMKKYHLKNSATVTVDDENFAKAGIKLVKGNYIFIKDGKYVRHECDKLALSILGEYEGEKALAGV